MQSPVSRNVNFYNRKVIVGSGVASPTVQSRNASFKLLPLFISLEIDCFHSQSTVNICTAGLDRRTGYATDSRI